MFRLTGGGVRLRLGTSENLLGDGSRLDLDLCITGRQLAGLFDLWERFPVEVADLSLLTSGFSMGQGRSALDAVWRQSVTAELYAGQKIHYGALMWDLLQMSL